MYSDSYDTSGGCTRVSGVERMLKNIGRGKIHEKFPEIYVSEICGIRDAFFVLLYGVTYWEKCLCITAAIRYKR